MVSTSWADSFVLPQIFRRTEIRPLFLAAWSKLYKWCMSALLALTMLAVGSIMIILALGVHIPLFHSSPKATASAQVPSAKPKPLASPAVSTCSAPQKQSDSLFATCPSFIQDYSSQRTGSVNTGVFNIYTGAPEANHEAELYTNSSQNLRIDNGSLVLQALNNPQQGFNYTSARIDTKGKEDFLYGKLVVRAKMPNGIGTWPAIWMLPSQSRYASLSPVTDTNRYLNDGEIDIAELVGTDPHTVYGIAHSLAYPADGVNRTYFDTTTVPNNDTAFHDYELDWTPTSLIFSVDGKAYFSYTKKPGADYQSWPYDQPFYLILNLALGGSWGGIDVTQFPGDGVDKNALPASLQVQSVHYYSYIGPK